MRELAPPAYGKVSYQAVTSLKAGPTAPTTAYRRSCGLNIPPVDQHARHRRVTMRAHGERGTCGKATDSRLARPDDRAGAQPGLRRPPRDGPAPAPTPAQLGTACAAPSLVAGQRCGADRGLGPGRLVGRARAHDDGRWLDVGPAGRVGS